MQTPTSPIRLTQTVQKGGCAAKIAALELRKILAEVRFPNSPAELLIDTKTFDDAAITVKITSKSDSNQKKFFKAKLYLTVAHSKVIHPA